MSPPYPVLRPFARGEVPAPTSWESVDFDRRAIEDLGVPQPVLMENAGRSAAAVLQRLYSAGARDGPVVGVIGAGNNGGDALVLLRTLAAWGRDVHAILVAERPDDAVLLHGWSVPCTRDADLGDDDEAWARSLARAAVLVDGILGTGLRGVPRARQSRAIEALNRASAPVLAIDIPSGVDGTTGAAPGSAVRADVTVAFGAPKLGALLHPGRGLAGRIVAVEIGFPPMSVGVSGAQVTTPAWVQARLPTRGLDTHKNAVGRLVVVAGHPGMAGAALFCARAGLRAGAGLVQLCSPPANREVLQAAVPEAMYVDPTDDAAFGAALEAARAVAVGPGLGTTPDAEALLARVLSAGDAPLVLDADALNLLAASRGGTLAEVAARRPVLVTPHPGEMGRLRGLDLGDIAADRVGVARSAGDAFGCAVLLKGAPSVVAAPGRRVMVDVQGSSDLATAGMGDVLTGVCGALLAQGAGTYEAGALALALSGRAARLAGKGRGLGPADVIRLLPDAIAERGDGVSDLGVPFVTFDVDPAF